ncbi:unnamed protein product [Heterobilharzia americana]|nr:unnamed protein product [Heterobilharzia americana]
MQLLSMNDLWMVIATHVGVDNSSYHSASSQIGKNLIPTVILILVDIVTLLLTFVTKLRDSFPANVSVTLLAVSSLSAGAAVLLAELKWSEALIVLSMTAVIFMTAAIAGLKSKNLSGKGWKVFMWILVGFLLVGGVAASFIPLRPQLMTAVGISLSVALAISIFMTIDYLRYGSFNPTFSVILFFAYILWFQEMLLCLSITLCYAGINSTLSTSNNLGYPDIQITLH